MKAFGILVLFSWSAKIEGGHTKEKMKLRQDFVKRNRAPVHVLHDVIFSVNQNNFSLVEQMIVDRCHPSGPNYQKWLTFEEIDQLVSNPDGVEAVSAYLMEKNITVSFKL